MPGRGALHLTNLFRLSPAHPQPMTGALLTLLEHSDRTLLAEFLQQAGVSSNPGGEGEISFAADGFATPRLRIAVQAQGPGETIGAVAPDADEAVFVNPAGAAPEGLRGLTWEQVDRWLASAQQRFAPDTRTGFLVRQFREFLQESGIRYFEGFSPASLAAVSTAHATVTSFYSQADSFLEHLTASMAGPYAPHSPGGSPEVRRSRAEELLVGYSYRDFVSPAFHPASFARVALDLKTGRLQAALWLSPGCEAHGRLRIALGARAPLLDQLSNMDGEPLLRFWSPESALELSPSEWEEGAIPADWEERQVALELSIPLAELGGEGPVPRVLAMLQALVARLRDALANPVH